MNKFKLRLEGWNGDKQCLVIVTRGKTPDECVDKVVEWLKRDVDKWWLSSKSRDINANKVSGQQLDLELR